MSTEVRGPRASAKLATIPDSSNVSNAIDIGDGLLLSTIAIPASFEGGYIEFDVAEKDGGTYQALMDTSGNAIRYVAASSTTVKVDPQQFFGIQFFKIRSVDSGGSAANQTGAATLNLVSA